MKKIILLIAIFSLNLFAQNNLSLNLDHAQFKYDSTSNYFEIYYSIAKNGGNNQSSDIIMHIQIQNTATDELIVNKDWLLKAGKTKEEIEANNYLLGTLGFTLKAGSYNLYSSINYSNENESKKTEAKSSFTVTPFSNNIVSMSEIEIANRIINESNNKNSIFYKNTLEVFPNPSNIFYFESPIIFYYCEIYGLDILKSKITLIQKIQNSKNSIVLEKTKPILSKNDAVVEMGALNISKLPTDTYNLILTLKENDKELSVMKKKFFFINPNIVDKNSVSSAIPNYMSSEFGVLTEEECKDLYEKSKIIATADEKKQFERLDSLSHKREFLYNFWNKRDDQPSTSFNEFKNLYMTRVEIANERYKTMTAKGYNSDMGRVYLRFGEPDEIERHPNETDTKPYELWYYNQIEGGIYFVFADLTGFNYYQLLHSTKRGELQDPNWSTRIRTN